MNPLINSLSNFKQPNSIFISFIFIQLILIIFLAVSIPQLFSSDRIDDNNINLQPQVSITNLSNDISNLRADNISHIQRALFDVVEQSYSEASTSLAASLRTDTIKTFNFKRQNINYFTAILDIPEINQSYQIFYGYSDTENKAPNDFISILCAPDTINCEDLDSQPSHFDIAARYLEFFNFDNFSVFIKRDEPSKIYINPIKYSITDGDKKTYLQEIKGIIQSLGISPDLFTYEIIQPSDLNYLIPPSDQ